MKLQTGGAAFRIPLLLKEGWRARTLYPRSRGGQTLQDCREPEVSDHPGQTIKRVGPPSFKKGNSASLICNPPDVRCISLADKDRCNLTPLRSRKHIFFSQGEWV